MRSEERAVSLIDPEAIDEGFVAQPAAGVHTVELDGEAVVYDERQKRLHVLDHHGTLVWLCFDGVCSLKEVMADLVEVFSVDPAVVRADVMSLARSLGSEGLLAGVATSEQEEPPSDGDPLPQALAPATEDLDIDEPWFVPEPCASCLGKLDHLAWAGTVTLRIGQHLIGVRYNDEETASFLRRALPECLSEIPAPPQYSVRLAEPTDGRIQGLNLLYRSSSLVLRARTASRVHGALLSWLRAHKDDEDPGHIRLAGLALVRDGKAAFVPGPWYLTLERLEPHLRRRGIQVLDGPLATVDPATSELVVRPVLAAPAHAEVLGSDSDAVAPGRYPIVGRGVEAADGPSSLAWDVVRTRELLKISDRRGSAEDVSALGSLLRAVPANVVEPDGQPSVVAERLSLLLDH